MPFTSRSEEALGLVTPCFFSNIVEVCEALGLTFHLEKQRKPGAWALGFKKKLAIGVQEAQLFLSPPKAKKAQGTMPRDFFSILLHACKVLNLAFHVRSKETMGLGALGFLFAWSTNLGHLTPSSDSQDQESPRLGTLEFPSLLEEVVGMLACTFCLEK
jgi:hypothetical protein